MNDNDRAKIRVHVDAIKGNPEAFAAAIQREFARGDAVTAMRRAQPSRIERIADQWARGLDICGWWFWPLQTFLLGICVGMLTAR